MNGIRQYAALTLLPILTVFIFNKQYVRFFLMTLLAMSFHSSAVIFLCLIPLRFLYERLGRYCFIIFFISSFLYLWLPEYTAAILDFLGLRFSSYIDSSYFESGGYVYVITKLYYLPCFLLFFCIYRRHNEFIANSWSSEYFFFVVFIFACTYWSFLMTLDAFILSRVASYFWFFIIFPIYYNYIFLVRRYNPAISLIYIGYVIVPYFVKVTFLAKNEFIYRSYIFN